MCKHVVSSLNLFLSLSQHTLLLPCTHTVPCQLFFGVPVLFVVCLFASLLPLGPPTYRYSLSVSIDFLTSESTGQLFALSDLHCDGH